MLFPRVLRSKKKVQPKLEIRIIRTNSYGVALEATSNFFEGVKSEFFGDNDVWIFDMGDIKGE